MFSLFKKQKNSQPKQDAQIVMLASPLKGRAVVLEEVPDATFADRILGGGCAVIPECGVLTAPADGVIDSLPDTRHAVMMTTDSGAELLMHIGIDTVELRGEHFSALVKPGDRVTAGQPLIEFDPDAVQAAGYAVVTPVIVTNSDAFRIRQVTLGAVSPGEMLMELEKIG
ncbi:MAG: PTS glucose transporter subunit IIA [Clostridia bacterium]|nr:PTS glucose transporter subunit IIA [Clostridia bacterium]